MRKNNIVCGIHYESQHINPIYNLNKTFECPISINDSKMTVSIPLHNKLKDDDISHIIKKIKSYG